jgi:hypothetical protein
LKLFHSFHDQEPTTKNRIQSSTDDKVVDVEINEHLCGSIGKLKVTILQIPCKNRHESL